MNHSDNNTSLQLNTTKNSTLLRNFTHITIPAEIWLRRDISIQAKALWAELRSLHCKERGGCYASEEYLCAFMQLQRRRLYKIFKELKDSGLMEVISCNGKQTIRRAIVPEVIYKNDQVSAQQQCTKVHSEKNRSAQKCTASVHNTALTTYIENKEENKDNNTRGVGVSKEISFGENKNCKLSSEQYEKLLTKMSEEERAYWIETIDLECTKQGPKQFNKKYVCHYATILSWKRRRKETTKDSSYGNSPKTVRQAIAERELEDYKKHNGSFNENVIIY